MAVGFIFTCLDFGNGCMIVFQKSAMQNMLILVTSYSFEFNAKDCDTDYTSSLLLFVKYAVLVC